MTTPRRLPRPFTPEEQARLWPVLKERPELYWSCVFLNETGLRVSEFAGITKDIAASWPHPRWYSRAKGSYRFVGKGNVERVVPLTKAALRASERLVGLSPNGHLLPWSIRGFNYVLNQAGDRAGVECHAHRFRHTALTRWINSGADPYVVADLAGHLDVDTLRHYAKLSERRLRRALG